MCIYKCQTKTSWSHFLYSRVAITPKMSKIGEHFLIEENSTMRQRQSIGLSNKVDFDK